MRATRMMVAGCLLAAAGASWAQAGSAPMGPADYEKMRAPGNTRALMLSACEGNVPMAMLEALSKANMKATVFVSGEAIKDDSPFLRMLLARRDLFEIGNLGGKCQERKAVIDGIEKSYKQALREGEAQKGALRSLAGSIVEGSLAIEHRFGAKPKFFAFGLDFSNSAFDPYVQTRLLVGIGDYLARPSVLARFDALAGAKAGFDSWVILARLDRVGSGPLGGRNGYNESSISAYLGKSAGMFAAKKASEVWRPTKRAYLAKELGYTAPVYGPYVPQRVPGTK